MTGLTGRLVAGRGKARGQLDWQHPALARLLGAQPYAGTANVVLDRPVDLAWPPDLVLNGGRAFFWRGRAQGRPVLAYRWKTCPMHVVELVAAERLRDDPGMAEGAPVALDLPLGPMPRLLRRALWRALWAGRGAGYYADTARVARLARLGPLFRLACQRRPRPVADGPAP